MNPILLAIVSVVVIGVICAVMLVIASKVMAVKTDQRMIEIRAALPGANCGACGYAGCDAYAAVLADGSEERTNLCIPGGDYGFPGTQRHSRRRFLRRRGKVASSTAAAATT